MEKACKKCRRVVEGNVCPVCRDSQLTSNWKGYVMVINPENSEIAKKLDIKTPGIFALRIGK